MFDGQIKGSSDLVFVYMSSDVFLSHRVCNNPETDLPYPGHFGFLVQMVRVNAGPTSSPFCVWFLYMA